MKNFINSKRNFGRRNMRRPFSNRQPIVGPRDLSTTLLPGPQSPPANNQTPFISKKVRLQYPYLGATLTSAITPNILGIQDGVDYLGASTLRYNAVQVEKIEAWLGLQTIGTAVSPQLSITDGYGQATFADNAAPGVDWAHVAIRPCLHTRQDINAVSSISPNLTTVEVNAAAGWTGNLIIDVTCLFN